MKPDVTIIGTSFGAQTRTVFRYTRVTRPISPSALLTLQDQVRRWTQEWSGLEQAERLSPTNALALARLAALNVVLDPRWPREPRWFGQADYFTALAVKLAPGEMETWLARAAVLAATNRFEESL
jgi:hypothetical protein